MPVVELLYPVLGLYWVAVLLFLLLWRKHLCGARFPPALTTRPVAYSLELETTARYFNLLFWVLVLTFVPVYTALSYARFPGPQAFWVLTVTGTALTLIGMARAYRQLKAIRRLRVELQGNILLAEKLKEYASFEHRLFHDLPAAQEGFIDHVVVGPGGVVAIDSRVIPELAERPPGGEPRVIVDGSALTFPSDPARRETRYTTAIVRKARWLQTCLAIEGREYTDVRPVLVLTGWQVETAGRGAGITVMNETGTAALFEGTRVLSPMTIHRVTAHLERMSRATFDPRSARREPRQNAFIESPRA